MYAAIAVTATGAAFTGQASGVNKLAGVELTAAAAAATLVVRQVDASGDIIANLAAPIGTTVALMVPRTFKTALHCTITGAGAHGTLLL